MSNSHEHEIGTPRFGHAAPSAGTIDAAKQRAHLNVLLEEAKKDGITYIVDKGDVVLGLQPGFPNREEALRSIFRIWIDQAVIAPLTCMVEADDKIELLAVAMNPVAHSEKATLTIPVGLSANQHRKFSELQMTGMNDAMQVGGIALDKKAPSNFSGEAFIWPVPINLVRGFIIHLT